VRASDHFGQEFMLINLIGLPQRKRNAFYAITEQRYPA